MSVTKNYVDLENLSTFWDKAKDYINTSDSELEKKVDDVDSKIDTEIERSTNKDSAIDLEIAGVKESVTSLNTTLSGKIDDLEEKDSATDQEIAGVKESVASINTTLSGKIDDLEEKDIAIDQEIAGVKESIKVVNDNLNLEIQRSEGEDNSIKQRVKALEDANPIYNIVGDEDNVLVDITFTKDGNNVTASLNETTLSNKISEIEGYQVNGQKLSSGEVNLTSTNIKLGTDIDEYIDAYKADATIYETLTQLKRTIAATGGGSRIVAVLDELPETTNGFSIGDIILVDLKEYLCAPDAIGSDTTKWYLLGDVTDEGRRLSEIEASYVKSVKVAGTGVDVTPTEDTNGNVTISVDASSITREIETLKNADKVSSITTKDGTYVKLTPDSKTTGDVEISVDDNAIATALAERVSKTGDTMNGALTIATPYDYKMVFNNTDSEYYSLISFSQDGTQYAAFGTANNDQPRWYDANGGHNMLHDGNYHRYALPLSGGTLSANTSRLLTLNNNNNADNANGIGFSMSSVAKGWVGYDTINGTYLYTYAGPHKLGIKDDGVGFIDGNTIIHSGNLFDYKSQLTNRYSGVTTSGPLYIKLGYLPIDDSGNYASFHIHGVIGGWQSSDKSQVDLIVANRNEVIISGSIHNFGTGYWDIYVNDSLEIILHINSAYEAWDIELNSLQGTVDYQNNYTPSDTNWTLSAHSSPRVTRFDSNGNLMKDVTGNASSATTMSSFAAADSEDIRRYVWMSHNDNSGRPAYTGNLTFQTSTNTLFSTNFAGYLNGTADKVKVVNETGEGEYALAILDSYSTNSQTIKTSGSGDNRAYFNPANGTLKSHLIKGDAVGKDMFIAYPNGGQFNGSDGNDTGAIKIKLPVSWSSTMMMLHVDIYNYVDQSSATYVVGGYNYYDGHWYSTFAYGLGHSYLSDLNVRFGHDGETCCIYIGETTTQWSYPKISIYNVTVGHSTSSFEAFDDYWSISIVNSMDNITSTISKPNPIGRYLPLSGGTLTGSLKIEAEDWGGQLNLNRINNGDNWGPSIRFYADNSGLGAISMKGNELYVSAVDGTTLRHIIDSGNYTTYCASTGHTHDWSNINNVVVASNEFNFVPSGFNSEIWLNYRGKDFTSATVTGYRFGNGAGGCAPLYASNFITTSDRRLKKNITEIDDDRLKKSLDLNFYEFDYRNTNGHSAGHVAQDVKEVLPEFVRENNSKKDDINYLSLDYTGLHSMQIKALKNKCERLEDENKSLQSRIEKLEKLIEKLL